MVILGYLEIMMPEIKKNQLLPLDKQILQRNEQRLNIYNFPSEELSFYYKNIQVKVKSRDVGTHALALIFILQILL